MWISRAVVALGLAAAAPAWAQRPRAPDARPRHPMWTSVAPGELARMAGRLRAAGADVRYGIIPGQGHGGMLAASLLELLDDLSDPVRSGGAS